MSPTLRKPPLCIIFSKIRSPQKVETPIEVTLTASDAGFSGRIFFDSARGKMSPTYIDMVNGLWTGNVLLYSLGKDNHISIRWYANENYGGTSVSNVFDVVDRNNQIPNNAILIGKVTDYSEKPIFNVTVKLYSEDPKYNDVIMFNNTDRDGNYMFQNILPEEFFLKFLKPGYQASFQIINTAANIKITGNTVLHTSCKNFARKKKSAYQKDIVPVLLIPGIMGSKSKGWIYPSLPTTTPKWNEGKLKIHDPFGIMGWILLKLKLINYGYVEGCTLFEVPYDWTLSVENIRDQFLIPWIKHATRTKKKVDIIAHSMGGLVARSYIQSKRYAGDVRKLAMVGTPNNGADKAYYVWEGGDPIIADESSGDPFYFFTNTVFNLCRDRFSKDICSFKKFIIDTIFPKKCNNIEIYNYAHKSVHSVGQLMPIYKNALLDYQTEKSILIEKEENTFLKALNNLTCFNPKGCVNHFGELHFFNPPSTVFSRSKSESKVETQLFAGVMQKTLQTIFVTPQSSSYSGDLYKDGEPKLPEYHTFGDGTVLSDSVIFNYNFINEEELKINIKNERHTYLINTFSEEIIEFITDKEQRDSNAKISTINAPELIITINGRVKPTITGPSKITITEKDLKLDYATLEISNLADGDYVVTLESSHTEDYELSIIYADVVNKLFTEKRVRGYYDYWSKNFTFSVNLQSTNNTIEFDRTFNTPVDLQMHENAKHKMELTWQDPTAELLYDVKYYSIYWKRNYDAYFKFLANVYNETNYQTYHKWIYAIESTYVVKAKLKDNRSTFFSPPTWVNGVNSGSSATSLTNPFSMIISFVRSCITKASTLFFSSAPENIVLKECDNAILNQIHVTPSYQISTINKDILSQSPENHVFISSSNGGKQPLSDRMPKMLQSTFENLHANIMLGHVAIHWVNNILQWMSNQLSNSSIEKVNKRKVMYPESDDNFRLEMSMLKETLLETEKQVDYLIKVVRKNSINWVVWSLEDYESDIKKLEDKLKKGQVNLEEVLELKENIYYFANKVSKKYYQAIQLRISHDHDDRWSNGNVYESQTSACKRIFIENLLIPTNAYHGLLPVFSREIAPLNQNIDNISVKYEKIIA